MPEQLKHQRVDNDKVIEVLRKRQLNTQLLWVTQELACGFPEVFSAG